MSLTVQNVREWDGSAVHIIQLDKDGNIIRRHHLSRNRLRTMLAGQPSDTVTRFTVDGDGVLVLDDRLVSNE